MITDAIIRKFWPEKALTPLTELTQAPRQSPAVSKVSAVSSVSLPGQRPLDEPAKRLLDTYRLVVADWNPKDAADLPLVPPHLDSPERAEAWAAFWTAVERRRRAYKQG